MLRPSHVPDTESLRLYRSPLVRRALQCVRAAGHDLQPVMERYGLHPNALHDPETVIPLALCRQLMAECAELVGVSSLGVHLATTVPRGYLGVFELSANSAPTLREAARRFVRYLPLITPLLRAELDEGRTWVTLRQWIDGVPEAQGRHGNDFVPTALIRFARESTQEEVELEEVFLAHPRPRDIGTLTAFLGATPVRFGTGANGIVVRRETMDRLQIAANSSLMQVLDDYACSMLRTAENSGDRFVQELRRAILLNLTHSQALLPRVADVLGMTSRTLQRRLREHGLSFRSLVEKVRQDACSELHAQGKRGPGEIAYLLGYAERSSFSRASRRWRTRGA